MARVAAIDCGTNSIRLLVADVTTREDGTAWLRDVHREMRIVRLGQGVDATGRLAPEAIERTRRELADYVRILHRKGVEKARMVATSATRDASNRDDFFVMTEQLLGAPAEVISGDEEAQLSFVGATAELEPDNGPFLVTDIGGGSTELVLGHSDKIDAARSVDVGCVRLTERFLHDDPPTQAQVDEASDYVRRAIADAVPLERTNKWIGVAGTVTTLVAMAQDLAEYDSERIHLTTLSIGEVHATIDRLLHLSHDDRVAIGSMHPGRVDVINGGAIVVRVLAEELNAKAGVTTLTASEHDILDGIAFSLV